MRLTIFNSLMASCPNLAPLITQLARHLCCTQSEKKQILFWSFLFMYWKGLKVLLCQAPQPKPLESNPATLSQISVTFNADANASAKRRKGDQSLVFKMDVNGFWKPLHFLQVLQTLPSRYNSSVCPTWPYLHFNLLWHDITSLTQHTWQTI